MFTLSCFATRPIEMYYIRFLKCPPMTMALNCPFQIIWTIQNDLGDEFYSCCIELVCFVTSLEGVELCMQAVRYDPMIMYMKTDIYIDRWSGNNSENRSVKICLREKDKNGIWAGEELVPVWSGEILVVNRKENPKTVKKQQQSERFLSFEGSKAIIIKEDSGDSIARHIWDAGLTLCLVLQSYFKLQLSHSPNVPTSPLYIPPYSRILELGSGTGIVGLFLAALLSTHSHPAEIYLTDLPEAIPLLAQNSSMLKLNRAVSVYIDKLDWSETKHRILKESSPLMKFQIILMADVMYNPSTHGILMDTMEEFLDVEGRVFCGYRRRHDDEDGVWEALKRRGWKVVNVKDAGIIKICVFERMKEFL